MLRFELFGTVSATHGAQTVREFETRKVALLVAILALRPGRVYDRQTLSEHVWSDAEPEAARSSLRQALSALRRTLSSLEAPDDALLTTRIGASFNGEACTSDAGEFLRLTRAARSAPADEALGHLRAARGAFRGNFCEGLHVPWVEWARRMLRKRLDEVEIALIEALNIREEFGESAEVGSAMCAKRPTDEVATRSTMTALIALGRSADAVALFESHARQLHDRFQISPSARTRALLNPAKSATGVAAQHRIAVPAPASELFGREYELSEITMHLDPSKPGPRLVTLFGSGGIGKTRLAQEAAVTLEAAYPRRVAWVDLASTNDASQIIPLTLRAMGIPADADLSVADALASVGPAPYLAVLDNLEQFADMAQEPIATLIGAAPNFRVLASTRQRLELSFEQVLSLGPLVTNIAGASAAEIAESPAVRMFLDLARKGNPTLGEDESVVRIAAEVCDRVEGVPLAICLAAARADILSLQEIAEQSRDRFALLSTGPGDLPVRQRTLWDSIAWSYELLPNSQSNFAALSVFRGPWTLEAAKAITQEPQCLELVQMLVRRSLVQPVPGSIPARFQMLDAVREFAEGKVGNEKPNVRQRFIDYFAAWIDKTSDALIAGDEITSLGAIDAEFENVRQALDWALESDPVIGLKIAYCMAGPLDLRGRYREAGDWLDRAVEAAGDDAPAELLAGVASDRAQVFLRLRSPREALACLDRRASLVDMLEPLSKARFVMTRASVELYCGDLVRSRESFEIALASGHEAKNDPVVGSVISNIALVSYMMGDLETAKEFCQRALVRARVRSRKALEGSTVYTMANIAWVENDLPEAERLTRESIQILESSGQNSALSGRITLLAEILLETDRLQDSLAMLQHSVERLQDAGMARDLADCAPRAARWCIKTGQLSEAVAFLTFFDEYGVGFSGRSSADFRPTPAARLAEIREGLEGRKFMQASQRGREWTLQQMAEAICRLTEPEPGPDASPRKRLAARNLRR